MTTNSLSNPNNNNESETYLHNTMEEKSIEFKTKNSKNILAGKVSGNFRNLSNMSNRCERDTTNGNTLSDGVAPTLPGNHPYRTSLGGPLMAQYNGLPGIQNQQQQPSLYERQHYLYQMQQQMQIADLKNKGKEAAQHIPNKSSPLNLAMNNRADSMYQYMASQRLDSATTMASEHLLSHPSVGLSRTSLVPVNFEDDLRSLFLMDILQRRENQVALAQVDLLSVLQAKATSSEHRRAGSVKYGPSNPSNTTGRSTNDCYKPTGMNWKGTDNYRPMNCNTVAVEPVLSNAQQTSDQRVILPLSRTLCPSGRPSVQSGEQPRTVAIVEKSPTATTKATARVPMSPCKNKATTENKNGTLPPFKKMKLSTNGPSVSTSQTVGSVVGRFTLPTSEIRKIFPLPQRTENQVEDKVPLSQPSSDAANCKKRSINDPDGTPGDKYQVRITGALSSYRETWSRFDQPQQKQQRRGSLQKRIMDSASSKDVTVMRFQRYLNDTNFYRTNEHLMKQVKKYGINSK